MKSYTSDIAFDPLTMHFAIVMAIMIVAYGLLEVLHKIPLFSGFAIYVPATMKHDVIMNNAGAILTISLVGLALTTIVLMTLPRLWLKDHWLENAMDMFGSWTGSTATGMMLLRIADPELETDAGPNLITATPLWQISTQNFFLTIAPYFIVTAIGFRNLALGTTGMLLAALVLGFVIGRK